MRLYKPEDREYVYGSLKSEKEPDEYMTFERDGFLTLIDDNGFVTFARVNGVPRITHFFVNNDKRGTHAWLRLYEAFSNVMLKMGHTHCDVALSSDRPCFLPLVHKMGCNEPYNTDGDVQFFLVPLRGSR
jgi:hypothetical protein